MEITLGSKKNIELVKAVVVNTDNHTSSAGTITMRHGSYFTIRRIFPGNVGAFVA